MYKQAIKSLETAYEILSAFKWQLEDINPPETPEDLPKEIYERFAQDLIRFGLLVPLTATPFPEEFLMEFRRRRMEEAEIIGKAMEVIKDYLNLLKNLERR